MNAVLNIAPQPVPSSRVTGFFATRHRLYINGEWVEPLSGKYLPVFDPATGAKIAEVPDAGPADVDRAVAAAREAFESGPWPNMPPNQREALMWKLSNLVDSQRRGAHRDREHRQRQDQVHGVDRRCARGAQLLPLHGGLGHQDHRRHHADLDRRTAGFGARFHTYVAREPAGVVAQIVPWNFPLGHGGVEARPGARRRLHLRAEARRADTDVVAAPCAAHPGSRLSARRRQHPHRHRRDHGRGAGRHIPASTRSRSPVPPRSARSSTRPRPTRSSACRSSSAASHRSSCCPTPIRQRSSAARPTPCSSMPARCVAPARACTCTARSSTRWSRASAVRPPPSSSVRVSIQLPRWVRWSPGNSRSACWATSTPARSRALRWRWAASAVASRLLRQAHGAGERQARHERRARGNLRARAGGAAFRRPGRRHPPGQ